MAAKEEVEERTPMLSQEDTPFGLENFRQALKDFTDGGPTPMRAESCRMLMMYETSINRECMRAVRAKEQSLTITHQGGNNIGYMYNSPVKRNYTQLPLTLDGHTTQIIFDRD